MARCPAHEDRTPSLSVGDGDVGRVVVHCFGGCPFKAVRDALAHKGLWPDRGGPPVSEAELARLRAECRRREAADRRRREAVARGLWGRAGPPAGTLAEVYLTGRGLALPPTPALRFLPDFRHPAAATVPALVAAARRWPDDGVAAIQVTALAPPGRKADLTPARLTFGRLDGAAVRLAPWEPGRALILAEGVEDALAVLAARPDAAAWAALGAGNAAKIALPPGAEVILALDGDDAGRRAADEAARVHRGRGHRVRVARLPAGLDPNARLLAGRAAA